MRNASRSSWTGLACKHKAAVLDWIIWACWPGSLHVLQARSAALLPATATNAPPPPTLTLTAGSLNLVRLARALFMTFSFHAQVQTGTMLGQGLTAGIAHLDCSPPCKPNWVTAAWSRPAHRLQHT